MERSFLYFHLFHRAPHFGKWMRNINSSQAIDICFVKPITIIPSPYKEISITPLVLKLNGI